MTADLVVDVLGLRVLIEPGDALDAAQHERLRAAWSGAISADAATTPDLTVSFNAEASFDQGMEQLTVDVTLAALEALRGRALMFHAAGVADAEGRVVAFVGPSGRGKTTLSRALGRRFGYVSDETVAADESRSVHPYRKPLSVVRKDLPKEQVSPVDAGLLPVPAVPLRLDGLVLIDRDPELDAPQLSTVPLAEALPELVTQMSYLRDHPAPLQSIARLCDAVGGVRMLRYPDAETVPAIMPEILGAEPAASEWHPLALPAASGPYGVAQARDAIRSDDYLIVMVESELKVLDGIAPVIWQAAADGADLDGIIAAVLDAHGEPPTGAARQIVEDAVDELVVAGVLSRD